MAVSHETINCAFSDYGCQREQIHRPGKIHKPAEPPVRCAELILTPHGPPELPPDAPLPARRSAAREHAVHAGHTLKMVG